MQTEKKISRNNPNKANQYKPDPRQVLFLSYYLNPKSETFSNALQSGLKAGYSQEYSENLTSQLPTWLSEKMGDINLLDKAEKVLNKTLEYQHINDEGKIDIPLLGIQNKTAQFVAERLGKQKYSTRNELTGAEGEQLQIQIVQYKKDEDKDDNHTT